MPETTTPMTAEQRAMAVAVAKDVLAQLERADVPLSLAEGVYLSGYVNVAVDAADDLKSHVDLVQRGCEVCAKGALLLSKARLYGAVPLAPFVPYEGKIQADSDDVDIALADVFDRDTADLIECAFERSTWICGSDLRRGATTFGMRYDTAEDRLKAIMENVIAHGGSFVVDPVKAEDYMGDDDDMDDDDEDDDDEDLDDDDDDDDDDLDDDDLNDE